MHGGGIVCREAGIGGTPDGADPATQRLCTTVVRSAASGYASGNASQLLAGGRRINDRAATPPDGCAGDRIGRCRHVGSHSGCRWRCPRAAGRPQPDRPGRRHRDGHDDGRRRRWRGDTGRLALSLSGHPDRRPRALRPKAGAAALRGRSRLHPAAGRLGRRLGAQGRTHRAGPRARSRPAALRLRRLSQHWSGGFQDPAHGAAQTRARAADRRPDDPRSRARGFSSGCSGEQAPWPST